MLILNLSEAEIQQLNYERFQPHSPLVQKRLHCIYLKSLNILPHQLIANIVDICCDSVTNYIRLYQSEGLQGLITTAYGTNQSELDKVEGLESMLNSSNPATINQAKSLIEQFCDLSRSPTQIRSYFNRIGMKRLKTGQIPAKADSKKQRNWHDETLKPLINRAENGEIHLFFVDAAHFVFAPFLCYLWCFARVFINGAAGRKRFNVLGALNAITKQVHFCTNSESVNALTVIELLYQLAIYYFDKPIFIVLDNARYQHCKLVKEVAKKLGIRLEFLPAYSPNLNLIERLWKWVKKQCLYAKNYDSFDDFKMGILNTLKKANQNLENKNELRSWLSLNFQFF